MKFQVDRASYRFCSSAQPCKDAYIDANQYPHEPMSRWIIELNSLEEIIQFVKEEGEIIIREPEYKDMPYRIKIYDSYIE